jgi:hypothetical protein
MRFENLLFVPIDERLKNASDVRANSRRLSIAVEVIRARCRRRETKDSSATSKRHDCNDNALQRHHFTSSMCLFMAALLRLFEAGVNN